MGLMFLVCFYIFESARFNAKILPQLRSRATKPAWAQGCSRARKTQDGYDSPCSISAPSKTAIAALLGRLAIHESIGPSHEDGTSDGVANGHGEQVVHEDHFPGDLGALEEAHREEEHVGDRVLEAHRDKGRDREPDAKHLADYVLCRGRLPDAHDDEPIAKDAPHHCLAKRQVGLHGGDCLDGSGRGRREGPGREHQVGEKDGANKVAQPRHGPDRSHERVSQCCCACLCGVAGANAQGLSRHAEQRDVDAVSDHSMLSTCV